MPKLSEAKAGEVADISTDDEWSAVLADNDVVISRSRILWASWNPECG